MTDIFNAPRRAGFWRRFGALLVDAIIILLPLQILTAVLFAQTNGAVQGNFGFTTSICQTISRIPDGLQPSPPSGANSITECSRSLLGFETARTLSVGTVTQQGNVTTGQFVTYALDANGKPISPFDMTWVAMLTLLIYLIVMDWRRGATFGKRVLGMRTIDTVIPFEVGIPLRKSITRQLAVWIGAIPGICLAIYVLLLSGNPLTAMTGNGFWSAFAIAFAIQFGWILWIIVSVSRKRDPIYDRIAGTSVLRTS